MNRPLQFLAALAVCVLAALAAPDAQAQADPAPFAAMLLTEVEKPLGAADPAKVATLLAQGADPNGHQVISGSKGTAEVPLLLVAAAIGHAEIVSILITAGAAVTVGYPFWIDSNVVHLAAWPIGLSSPSPPGINRATRASVLYYFGGGLDVRNTLFGDATFDWDMGDRRRFHGIDLLAESSTPRYVTAAGENEGIIYQMADYIRARGGTCSPSAPLKTGRVCTGPCDAGKGVIDGVCGACPANQIPQDGICAVCPAGEGVLADGATCDRCPAHHGVENGVCVRCSPGQGTLPNGACGSCGRSGYQLRNGRCEECPEGQGIRGTHPNCVVCDDAEFIQDRHCVACPTGKISQDNVCVDPGAGSCGDLTPAKFYDSEAGACVAFAACRPGATLNRVANQCECAGAAVPDGAGTGCLCESPNVGTPGACAAPGAESCGGLTPAMFYDSAAGECAAFAVCDAPAVLNRVANQCECAGAAVPDGAGTGCLCESPNVGTPEACAAPGAESCGGLTPAMFYDSAAGECAAFVVCDAPAVLNAGVNLCDCPAPNVGTDGAAPSGDCAVPSAEICEGLTPAKFYDDSGAGECVEVAACQAGATLNRAANRCECAGAAVLDGAGTGCLCESPNVGTPGACAAPSAEICEGLTPAKFYDAAAGECVAVAACRAGATLNRAANRCECAGAAVPDGAGTGCLCESPNVGTPGACAAPSAESCGGLTPAKFYDDSGAGECVAVAACLAPAVLNTGTNLCDCPEPNIGTDGVDEPGDCAVAVPGVGSCGELIPAQFYSATLSACVPIPNCRPTGATLNAAANRCDCPADSVSRGGACISESEDDFGELSDELLCGAFGGTVRTATGGDVCSGMDANDTFCIMDAEEADSVLAFPCRGLFKHLWACNVKHNRPALNPFFCGENCGGQKAVGAGCQ